MSYEVKKPPSSAEVEDISKWAEREFEEVSRSMQEVQEIELRARGRLPEKPRVGMIIFADGESLDPGSGMGWYGWDGEGWKKFTIS